MEDVMKKIMVFLMILVASVSFASDWLSVEMSFQLGWIPQGNINMYTIGNPINTYLFFPCNIVFKIDTSIYTFIKIGGSCTSYFSFTNKGDSPINFAPTGITYQIYLGVSPTKGISIIYEHSCTHPVLGFLSQYNQDHFISSGYDRIYFEIKGNLSF
jgi:hypothetical protein